MTDGFLESPVKRALQIAFINISLSLLSGPKSQNTEMGALTARDGRTASQYTNVMFGLLRPEEKKTVYVVAASTYHRLTQHTSPKWPQLGPENVSTKVKITIKLAVKPRNQLAFCTSCSLVSKLMDFFKWVYSQMPEIRAVAHTGLRYITRFVLQLNIHH